jgi:hypothetical protein
MIVAVSDARTDKFIPETRVLLDGSDVSSDCFRAEVYDDGSGIAYLYAWDKSGKGIATYHKVGRVEIVPPPRVECDTWNALQMSWSEMENSQQYE